MENITFFNRFDLVHLILNDRVERIHNLYVQEQAIVLMQSWLKCNILTEQQGRGLARVMHRPCGQFLRFMCNILMENEMNMSKVYPWVLDLDIPI